LEELLSISLAHPDAIVQGRTEPDPYELEVFAAPHARSITVDPPDPYVQACNVLYPRTLLDEVGGFDESEPLYAGEDTDLAWRAQAHGARVVPAPAAVVYHSVEAYSLAGMIRLAWKWRDLARVVKRHPRARATLPFRVFWKRSHLLLLLALAGLASASVRRPLGLLSAPYVTLRVARRGLGFRRVAISVLELPGQAAVDVAEMFALLAGSLKHRTLLL
jgi:GT2 family glycosyltransferase